MSEDIEIVDTKAFKAAQKLMGEKNASEFLKKSNEELKELLALNSVHIEEATQKTKQNDAYRKATETVADFKGALRESLKSCMVSSKLAAMILSSRKTR